MVHAELSNACPDLITDPDLLVTYRRDEADLCDSPPPLAVARPRSTAEVAALGKVVATNAGGMCCVKYGVTTEYVLALTVVLAVGEVLRCGRRTAVHHAVKAALDPRGILNAGKVIAAR